MSILERKMRTLATGRIENRRELSPRLERLKEVFEFLAESTYEGVPGVIKIEGGKPGPTFGITACTHGNEPAGLAAAAYVLTEIAPRKNLLSGTIFIVLNNIDAARRYFNASDDDEARRARFVDVNLNRIPDDSLEDPKDLRSEISRTRELLPIIAGFDVGLDIHSTTQDAEPMIIALGGDAPMQMVAGMPIQKIISNIDTVQIGTPIASLYGAGRPNPMRLSIEAGSHEKPETFDTAVSCVQTVLGNLGMFPEESRDSISEYDEYFVFGSVFFPNESYSLTKLFENFEFIPAGTVLALGDGVAIVATEDCHALFASRLKPDSLAEEVMFLTKPMRKRKGNETE